MKLSEALILRADYQKRLVQLQNRIKTNATVQEGENPAENPEKLLKEYLEIADKLEVLIQQINRTNANSIFKGTQTISDVITKRDVIYKKLNMYRSIADAASIYRGRVSRSEVKFISTMNVEDIQKSADELAKAYRELDTKIQEANWAIDLKE